MTNSTSAQELEDIDAMFVQTAAGLDQVGNRILLRDVTPATLYFSDRPQRIAGHIATPEFVELWDKGDDSFAADPPNAVLSFTAAGDTVPEDVVIEISQPVLDGTSLSYQVAILEGALPASKIDACTLFIDPFGRPLSPVSVAGMRRRTRRRTRRRAALLY
jgi:hypothetical protein